MSNNAMSNETDLDWLARNVHVWPFNILDAKPTEKYVWNQPYDGGEIVVIFRDKQSVFNRYNWLARRAELQNKPRWADAPEWATNLVQIGSGAWVWCDNDRLEMKFGGGDRFEHSGNYGAILGDWRDTLEKRPEQNEFEPLVSIEDS